MKEFLQKIGLIKRTYIELKTEKNEFVKKLRNSVDESNLGWTSSFLEPFFSSENDYKGTVDNNGFRLRKRLKMAQQANGMPIAKGKFRQKDDLLLIELEINGFKKAFYFIYPFLLLIYVFFIIGFSFVNDFWVIIPFIVLHASFMIFLPYFFMRKGVKNMKKELEKEFVYIVNKS
ncbi:hypothetical protein [Tenacibaculum sp. M341]|uniref:hypothetical protein n=1 Tax=Tenacibaculum sp. M341 TaxID=2530339 RepID=UPI00104F0B1D|nr:hypothetical protein [Tenacibaculum sp. M341]TCI85907.1 hypothetical protein EYW44_15790 [Tenacibaculum sp. M341]